MPGESFTLSRTNSRVPSGYQTTLPGMTPGPKGMERVSPDCNIFMVMD